MKRVLIIGRPGSGKSTFARVLKELTGLPLYYLDMLYHKPDKTTASQWEFDKKLQRLLVQNTWILDGNYTRTLPLRLTYCDTVFWLKYPLDVSLKGIASRMGQPREDMPWIETKPDPEFLEFVKNFDNTEKRKIEQALSEHAEKSMKQQFLISCFFFFAFSDLITNPASRLYDTDCLRKLSLYNTPLVKA